MYLGQLNCILSYRDNTEDSTQLGTARIVRRTLHMILPISSVFLFSSLSPDSRELAASIKHIDTVLETQQHFFFYLFLL